MAGNTEIIDHGWDEYVAQLKAMSNKPHAKVGYPEDGTLATGSNAGSGQDPIDNMSELALIAMWNDFGTKNGRIPSRRFFRDGIDLHIDKINQMGKRMVEKISKGEISTEDALDVMGLFVETKIKENIDNSRSLYKKNADLTIELKKSDHPLIDTGQLKESVQHIVEMS